MAIFCELLHSSPLNPTLATLLARWLESVLRFAAGCERKSVLAAIPPRPSHTHAASALLPALQSTAAMSLSLSYVLAALYLLGDTNAHGSNTSYAQIPELFSTAEGTIRNYSWTNLPCRGRSSRRGRDFFKKLFFAVNQRIDVIRRQFKAVTVGDRIRRARFHAVSAENAPRVIDIIDAGVALARGNAVVICIFSGFNVNAIRRTCRGTEKTAHALL